jgi:hypothetical protein
MEPAQSRCDANERIEGALPGEWTPGMARAAKQAGRQGPVGVSLPGEVKAPRRTLQEWPTE